MHAEHGVSMNAIERMAAGQLSFVFGAICVLIPMWSALEMSLRHRQTAELEVIRLRDRLADVRGVDRIKNGRVEPPSPPVASGNSTGDQAN